MKNKFPEGRFIYPGIYSELNVLRWRENGMAIPPNRIPEHATDAEKFFTRIAWQESQNEIWGKIAACVRESKAA
jgi:hypothetical protein